jgi:phage/plasmid-like protein (TIGR03299 family)
MAHELDINVTDTGERVASFAVARQHAWHRLGTVFATEMTVAEALAAANLANWDVRKLPLTATELTEHGVTSVDVPDFKHVVRTNPVTKAVEGLGVVGKGFQIVQNEEHGEFLEALLDQSGARFIESAGALRGGRQVFYCAKLPDAMLIGGTDRHDLYVTAMNGHDGSMAFSAIASPVRVVCANTQAAAIRSAQQRWAVRHTAGASGAVADARKVMDLAFRFNAEFEREAERMIQETLTAGEFERIVAGLFPEVKQDAAPRTKTNAVQRMGVIRDLWTAPTQQNIAGTRWAGYNALTEYVDHYASARATGEDAKAEARALAAITGDGAALKRNAFDAFRVPSSKLATV